MFKRELREKRMIKLQASRDHLWKKQKGRCYWCDKFVYITKATVDHLIPRSRGGSDNMGNLVMSCHDCNQLKGSNTIDYMRRLLK